MRIETTAGDLKKSIAIANEVLEPRNTIPVLGCIRLKDSVLSATDLDMAIHVKLPTKSQTKSEAVVNFSPLARLLKYVPSDEDVTVDLVGRVAARFNGSEYELSHSHISDYPEFKSIPKSIKRQQTGNYNIASALKSISFAICTEETRYYLNGACLSQDRDGEPVVVATNGHSMAFMPISADVRQGHENLILPRKFVDIVTSKAIEPQSVAFSAEGNYSEFDFAGVKVETKLIDGTFPDWLRVVPNADKELATFNRKKLELCIKRLASYSGSRNRAVKFTISSGSAELQLMRNDDATIGVEKIECQSNCDDAVTCGYNSTYLEQILSAFSKSEEVTICCNSGDDVASAPVLFKSDTQSLQCVLMPMRV